MAKKLSIDWYDTPMYYDLIFSEHTELETDFLLRAYQIHANEGLHRRAIRVLEPACGSGRLVESMARRGCTVAGFDGNDKMLEFAKARLKREALKARLWQDRMERFTLPARESAGFDLAHCLVSTFKYLLTEADAVGNLQCVADALRPGGLYFLGLHLTDYARTSCEHERWVGVHGSTQVVCNTRTWPADSRTRLEPIRTRLRITVDGSQRVQETRWQFRTYDAKQLGKLLKRVPALEHLVSYDFRYDLGEPRSLDDEYADILLVLRKR